MSDKKLVYLYVIANRRDKQALLDDIANHGGALIDFMYGHGYYARKTLSGLLGFSDHSERIIITGLIARDKSIALIDHIEHKYAFHEPETGIAFTIPVEKLVY